MTKRSRADQAEPGSLGSLTGFKRLLSLAKLHARDRVIACLVIALTALAVTFYWFLIEVRDLRVQVAWAALAAPKGEISRGGIAQALETIHRAGQSLARLSLAGENLFGICLSGSNLHGCDLSHSDLTQADLREANLSAADLSSARMVLCDLRGAALFDADLRDVDFSRADLSNARLSTVDLTGAVLTGAILRETDLQGANLSEAQGLTLDMLREAFVSRSTIPPPSFLSEDWADLVAQSELRFQEYVDPGAWVTSAAIE